MQISKQENKNMLLIIDVQRQFKDSNGAYEKILSFIAEHAAEYDQAIATVFSRIVNGKENKNYIRHLGWEGCSQCGIDDLEFETKNMEIIVKNGYSATELNALIRGNGTVDIIGCDSDACVYAIAFGLWDAGINFRILTDYIYTTANTFDNDTVIAMMRRNFGDCIV